MHKIDNVATFYWVACRLARWLAGLLSFLLAGRLAGFLAGLPTGRWLARSPLTKCCSYTDTYLSLVLVMLGLAARLPLPGLSCRYIVSKKPTLLYVHSQFMSTRRFHGGLCTW